MKENIFPEIKQQLTASDGKYYLSVHNWPATYHITGAIVEKDAKGYFVDAAKQKAGKHKVVFEGKDLPVTVLHRDLQNQKNWTDTMLPITVLT